MKTLVLFLFAFLSLSGMAQAQRPVSATLTNPKSMTIKFDPKQKIPPLNLSCKMTNGKQRPFDCEFSFDKLEFIGNDGSVLATVKPVKGQPAISPLPFTKAKKSAPAGQTGLITYTAQAYFTRRSKPAFSTTKGYQIRTCLVTNCLQTDQITTVVNGLSMSTGLFDQVVVTFDLSWVYGKKNGGIGVGPHEIYIENDVTTTKFSSSVSMRDKAEAWIDINPSIIGDPSPAN